MSSVGCFSREAEGSTSRSSELSHTERKSELPVEFETTTQYHTIIRMLGYNAEKSVKITIIYPLLIIIGIVNITLGILHNWTDLERRILRLKDLQHFSTMLFLHIISLSIEKHVDMVEDHLSKKHEIAELADVNRKFSTEHSFDLKKYSRYTLIILAIRNSAIAYLPMAYSVLLVVWSVVSGQSDTLHRSLPIITHFHHPQGYATWQFQLALNTLATYFYAINNIMGGIILMTNYFLIHINWYQLRLFSIYMEELDKVESWEEAKLRRLMNSIIKYHQHIMVYNSKFIKLGQVSIVAHVFGYTLQLCTSIYSIIEMRKVKFLFQMVFSLIVLYLFSSYGQKITDEGDRIQDSLFKCDWTGRPVWFQKNLLTMMNRAVTGTEISYHGILYMNRLQFSRTLQAAYTYLNFLKETAVE